MRALHPGLLAGPAVVGVVGLEAALPVPHLIVVDGGPRRSSRSRGSRRPASSSRLLPSEKTVASSCSAISTTSAGPFFEGQTRHSPPKTRQAGLPARARHEAQSTLLRGQLPLAKDPLGAGSTHRFGSRNDRRDRPDARSRRRSRTCCYRRPLRPPRTSPSGSRSKDSAPCRPHEPRTGKGRARASRLREPHKSRKAFPCPSWSSQTWPPQLASSCQRAASIRAYVTQFSP